MTEDSAPKRRGRPKGSTNKAKTAEAAPAEKPRAVTGEVIVPGEATQAELATAVTATVQAKQVAKRLATIATAIRKEVGKGNDAMFAIGRLLVEARGLMPSDKEFGKWVEAEGFGISQPQAYMLRQAAEREDEVRAFIADRSAASGGRDINPVSAIKLLNARPKDDDGPSSEERAAGKRVRELLADVPAPVNGFLTWQAATEQLDLTTLTVEELGQFGLILKALVEGYQAERKRRTA